MPGSYIWKEQESLNSYSNRKLYLEVDLKYDSSWHGIYYRVHFTRGNWLFALVCFVLHVLYIEQTKMLLYMTLWPGFFVQFSDVVIKCFFTYK
jgi:hypothetical protein